MAGNAPIARRECRRRHAEEVRPSFRSVAGSHGQARQRAEVASRDDDVPTLTVVRERSTLPERRTVAEWPANNGLVIRALVGERRRFVDVDGVASFAFATTGPVVATAETLDDRLVHDTWIRSVLPLVVQARGRQVLHASAIRTAGGIVAFCGQAGAGKSTMAAILHGLGHEVVADDALGIEPNRGSVTACPVPFRLRLRPESSSHLGLPAIALTRGTAEPAPLRRVVLLEDAGSKEPAVAALHGGEAFASIMPHAYCFELDGNKEQLVAVYAHLCATVPVTRFAYPRSFGRVDATVEALQPLLRSDD